MTTSEFLPPVSAGQVLATSLEAMLSNASLNLGDRTPEGQRLEHPDAQEAWLSLMSASALLVELAPVLDDSVAGYYRVALVGLLERFAKLYPEQQVPKLGAPGAIARAIQGTA